MKVELFGETGKNIGISLNALQGYKPFYPLKVTTRLNTITVTAMIAGVALPSCLRALL